jgi:hypothetical protein
MRRTSRHAQDGPCTGCRCSLLRRDNGRERLRVILPSICRLPRPADNCHSNKYPLWVSAIDENAWSLRPGYLRSKRQNKGMCGMFSKGSGSPADREDRSHALRGNAARDAPRPTPKPNAERPLRHSHAERGNDQTTLHCGSEPARESGVSGAADFSWPSPTANPPPTAAHGAGHAHTASRRSRPRGSAAPTARCRSGHGWPGRSPACRCRPCSAHR